MTMNEQFKREVIECRMEILQAMDKAVRNMNDEDCMEPWLMCGVPDGADEEDYESIAEDHETYTEMVELFSRLVKKYAKEDF